MSMYLITLDREDVSNSTSVSRLVSALTSHCQTDAVLRRRRAREEEHQAWVDDIISKGGLPGFDMARPTEDELDYEDYILPDAFIETDLTLPWSVHLLPPLHDRWLALEAAGDPHRTGADFKETFDDARDIIRRMAIEQKTVLIR